MRDLRQGGMSVLVEVHIEPKQEGKGRAFRAMRLASVTADALWDGGQTEGNFARPVYASFLGSEDELRPFVANLLLGRAALCASNSRWNKSGYEFLKSAGYKYIWQREAEGAVVSIFLPELFLLDPGMVDPVEAKFVLLPSVAWAREQRGIDVAKIVRYARRLPLVQGVNAPPTDHWDYRDPSRKHEEILSAERLSGMVVTAYLFAAYLDRRTRAPLIADGRFYLQILLACLGAGLASWASKNAYSYGKFGEHKALNFSEETEAAGFLPGVAFQANHDVIETLLAAEVATYFQLTKGGR